MGGSAPAVLNAANEVAVARFLERRIGFTEIPRLIEAVLARSDHGELHTLADVLEADRDARARTDGYLGATANVAGASAETPARLLSS
jgi:1-deoxy-D-xylulose-5-phosphate reductoisomerase